MNIKTNNVPREVINRRDLTPKESKQFDYLDPEDSGSFFRYKGRVYDLGEFMLINSSVAPHPQREGWEGYDGYSSDSFFSGLLVRYVDDCERVIVALYTC